MIPVEVREFCTDNRDGRAGVAGLCGVLLEGGEEDDGDVAGGEETQGVLHGFERAAHGARDYELNVLCQRERLEIVAELGALGRAAKFCEARVGEAVVL